MIFSRSESTSLKYTEQQQLVIITSNFFVWVIFTIDTEWKREWERDECPAPVFSPPNVYNIHYHCYLYLQFLPKLEGQVWEDIKNRTVGPLRLTTGGTGGTSRARGANRIMSSEQPGDQPDIDTGDML